MTDQRAMRKLWMAASGALREVSELRWAAAAVVLFAGGLLLDLTGWAPVLSIGLYAACYVVGGWHPIQNGIEAIRSWRLDVDVLMVVAAVAAAAIGHWDDGALLIVIFATSGAFETLATSRTERSISELIDLTPDHAYVIDSTGATRTVEAGRLEPGDRVLVRPGDRVAADGVVLEGVSELDQAGITGEPLPVPKQPGDEVFAGTVNGAWALTVEVRRRSADSVAAQVARLVTQATESKPPTQLFIERFEQHYAVGVVVVTLAVLTAAPVLLDWTWETALLRAMTFMIVASPCAVVLATMPALLSSMATAGRHGVLIKGSDVLERLARADVCVLDKTGTLTEGHPEVTEVVVLGSRNRDEVLEAAAIAERASEHPLSQAIVSEAERSGLRVPMPDTAVALPGQGVRATAAQREIVVGNRRLLTGLAQEALVEMERLEAEGGTAVAVSVDGEIIGLIGLHDRVRHGAETAIAELRRLGFHPVLMLTGDDASPAARVAESCGIDEFRAGLLPEDKVAVIENLRAAGRRPLVIGDGINDAPALAAADTSVAMGLDGSGIALETADIVLRTNWLHRIPAAVDLARRANRRVRENLVLALSIIVVAVAVNFAGHLPLVVGVLVHEGSTLIVALNGVRLLGRRNWRESDVCERPREQPSQDARRRLGRLAH